MPLNENDHNGSRVEIVEMVDHKIELLPSCIAKSPFLNNYTILGVPLRIIAFFVGLSFTVKVIKKLFSK